MKQIAFNFNSNVERWIAYEEFVYVGKCDKGSFAE